MKTLLMAVLVSSMVMAETEVKLWNGDMPGVGAEKPEGFVPDKGDGTDRLTNVSEPSLTMFLLKSAAEPAPFVIVCPGGGYNILSWNKEGTEIAEWLNSVGVSAAVLKYRCPKNREGALLDARRAVRMAREHSSDWKIDPEKIGMLGFSAGGHLTAACSNSEDRPNFSVLVYPAYLYRKGSIELSDDIEVDAETPPAFVVQTLDDTRFYKSTLAYAAALDEKSISCEVHLFAKGGHGYGMRDTGHPVSQWPKLCAEWMRAMEFVK